jgi:hypothetical protein
MPFGLPTGTIMAIDIFRVLTRPEASQLLADEMRATLGWHTAD